MKLKLLILLALTFCSVNYSYQQTKNDSTYTDTTSFTPNTNFTITISKIDGNNLITDGILNEPQWEKALKLNNFTEIQPRERAKPEADTEVLTFYDPDNIYFAFICHEPDIKSLRKSYTERDKNFNDDFVGVILDTYSESKNAYELIVNPYGIQSDLMWVANKGEDDKFDALWHSGGKIYKDKWIVEIAIPFKSLRFPHIDKQSWQFHLFRTRPRKFREQYFWVPISRDAPNLFTESGKITGLNGIRGGKNLEILPYAMGTQTGYKSDYDNANSDFINDKIKGQFGLNLKYGILSNLTADLAINPDFSQVESDAAQIDVNTSFALYYPEKRPFFIEGNSIFNSPTNVVYTRTINSPLFAVKLTGKAGKTDIGFTVAYDRNSPFILPFQDYSDNLATDRKSITNIVRLKHSLWGDSYIGGILTDREVNKDNNRFIDIEGYNRVIGLDGMFRFLDNYSLTFQSLYTATREINYPTYSNSDKFDNGKHTAALDGEYFGGFRNIIKLNRSARHWNFNLFYEDASPNVRTDNGFMNSNDFRILGSYQGYTLYPETKIISTIEPSVYGQIRHTYDGKLKEIFLQAMIYMQLANQINLNGSVFLVNNEMYNGTYLQGVRRFFLNANINPLKFLRGGFFISMGESIVREDNPYVGFLRNFELYTTFKPFDKLVTENSYIYYDLSNSAGGEKIFAGYIFRNKTNFQFNQNLTLRIIFQYDTFNSNLSFDPLISYRLNPFTVFYLGSTHLYSDLMETSTTSKYVLSDRQYFLKMQYLWRI